MKEQVKKYHLQKKGKKWIAKRLNITEVDVNNYLKDLILEGSIATNYLRNEPVIPDYSITYSTQVNLEDGTLKSEIVTDFAPKNDEELADLHKVDLTKYKISSYWTKQKGDKFTSSLYCTLRKPADYSPEDFAKFLEAYNPPQLSFTLSGNLVPKEEVDVEISIADFHLSKKTLEGESLADKIKHFTDTVNDLVNKVEQSFAVRDVVFPISNDFFHTDNYQNQTTSGTPQDVLVGFDHEYEVGFDLLVKAITRLKASADNVYVVLMQGNHDRTKSFYLAHALEVFFKNVEGIYFDRAHSVTKSVVLGKTFIGYHHGNCKIEQLPLLFSTGKDSFDFGAAKYREVHTGDKHHYMAKEIMGCRIQQMPSLSGTDRWHEDNNFVHIVRAGLALVYHPTKGKIAEFESRI